MQNHGKTLISGIYSRNFVCVLVPSEYIARKWRGGRVVEGARLESVYAGNRIAGSNPAPSATFDKATIHRPLPQASRANLSR